MLVILHPVNILLKHTVTNQHRWQYISKTFSYQQALKTSVWVHLSTEDFQKGGLSGHRDTEDLIVFLASKITWRPYLNPKLDPKQEWKLFQRLSPLFKFLNRHFLSRAIPRVHSLSSTPIRLVSSHHAPLPPLPAECSVAQIGCADY